MAKEWGRRQGPSYIQRAKQGAVSQRWANGLLPIEALGCQVLGAQFLCMPTHGSSKGGVGLERRMDEEMEC